MKWLNSSAFLVFCLLAGTANALAASQLTSVRVQPSSGGNTIVMLGFAGGIPAGWHINGIGTQDVTVVLPMSTVSPLVSRLSYTGTNALQSLRVSTVPGEVDLNLTLSSPVPIFSATSGGAISLVIGPAPPSQRPPTRPQLPQRQPSNSTRGNSTYVVVPLKYADVSEVVGILVQGQTIAPNDNFQPAGSIFSLPTSPGSPGAAPQVYQNPPTGSQPESFGERVNDNIAIDRRLNAIVLSGTPQQVADLQAEIEQIDVPLPSVMLVCEVVELSETAARDLGLDFSASGSGSAVGGGNAVLTTGMLPAFRADFQASLFATIAHGGGHILATPRVVALNGTPAQILTGDALPIISTTIFPGPPVLTQQTVNYIAVGINLQIQPRITSDRYVTSHIFAEVSSVTAYVPTPQGNVPQISLRQATTMATVSDGQPFVIGGLLQDQEIRNMSKIPGIGDVPLIGGLFRVRHEMDTHTNLYILITPHILQPTGAPPLVPALPKPHVPGPTPNPY